MAEKSSSACRFFALMYSALAAAATGRACATWSFRQPKTRRTTKHATENREACRKKMVTDPTGYDRSQDDGAY